MGKKTFPRKPFRFGKFIIEYKEGTKNPVHFLKEVINTEAEATAQEFNRLMQGAEYKGKNVFVDTAGSEYLSMGGRNAEMTFGLGKIEYSELFSALRKVQEGLPNAGQLVSLVKLPSDAILGNNVNFETVVGTDSLEIGVSSNLGRPDLLTLQDT